MLIVQVAATDSILRHRYVANVVIPSVLLFGKHQQIILNQSVT